MCNDQFQVQAHNRKHILEQIHLEKLATEQASDFFKELFNFCCIFVYEFLPFKKSFIENFQSLALG